MKKNKIIKKFEDIADYVLKNAKPGDTVITMGAGTVWKVGDIILNK